MLLIQVTLNGLSHMARHGPHALQRTTNGTFITEFFFSVSNIISLILVARVLSTINIGKNLCSVLQREEGEDIERQL